MSVLGPTTEILFFVWQATGIWRMPKMQEQFLTKEKYPKETPPEFSQFPALLTFETVVKAFRPPDAIKYSHAKPQEISLERRID
jgi:hypothetical protein